MTFNESNPTPPPHTRFSRVSIDAVRAKKKKKKKKKKRGGNEGKEEEGRHSVDRVT